MNLLEDSTRGYMDEMNSTKKKNKKNKVKTIGIIAALVLAVTVSGVIVYNYLMSAGLTISFRSAEQQQNEAVVQQKDDKEADIYNFIALQVKTGKVTIDDVENSFPKEKLKVICEKAGLLYLEDSNLERVIREKLGKLSGVLLFEDVSAITSLDASGMSISNLEGLQFFQNISELTLDNNIISNINILNELPYLTLLSVKDNHLKNIDSLGNVSSLKQLYLDNNYIDNLNAFQGTNSLEVLSLGGNHISDITSLSTMKSLTALNLFHNDISDIEPIKELIIFQA